MLKNMKQKLGGKKPAKESTEGGAGARGASAGARSGASGAANTRTNSKDRGYAGGAGAAGAGALPAQHLKPPLPDPCGGRFARRWGGSWEVAFQRMGRLASRSNHALVSVEAGAQVASRGGWSRQGARHAGAPVLTGSLSRQGEAAVDAARRRVWALGEGANAG